MFATHEATCTGCRLASSDQRFIPLLGSFCRECQEKLNQPFVYEGAVSGMAIEPLANGMHEEFERRKRGLVARMRHVLKVGK